MVDRDEQAVSFVMLLDQSRGRLFGFIHALVLNFADAEDLYQQMVVILWQKFDCYEPGTNFTSWAIRVADFTVKNFVRRRRRSRVLFDDDLVSRLLEEQAAVESSVATIRTDALAICLDRLPQEDRRLIEQCYGGEEKICNVARRQGRESKSLYVALHRIRRVLYNCIERTVRAEVKA